MRRRILAALMTLLPALLLSACGDAGASDAFEELRASMLSGQARLEATVTAFGEGGSYEEYRLSCVSDAEGSEVETLAPELIAGVKARIGAGSARIEYEGLILDAGEVSEGLSPVTALPMLCEAIRGAYVELAWTEGDESVVSLVPEDGIDVTLRLNGSGLPVSAEFTGGGDGKTLILCGIESFALN